MTTTPDGTKVVQVPLSEPERRVFADIEEAWVAAWQSVARSRGIVGAQLVSVNPGAATIHFKIPAPPAPAAPAPTQPVEQDTFSDAPSPETVVKDTPIRIMRKK